MCTLMSETIQNSWGKYIVSELSLGEEVVECQFSSAY